VPSPRADLPPGRLTKRRLFGIDRSGPPPAATLRGQPLRPWTIPNAVGFFRLGLVPVFLWLAFSSGDGRSTAATVLFWMLAATDYLDGILARVTGQYSRLGALLDPVVDRMLVVSAAVVCAYFDLLPRWLLAILAVREIVTLVLGRMALWRGLDLKISMLGRLAVWPTMGSLFLAMITDTWVADALLGLGVVMSVVTTARYLGEARRRMRGIPSTSA